MEETLAEEFKRLVAEFQIGERQTRAEAWNLIAEFAVDNFEVVHAALLNANPSPSKDNMT